MSSEVRIAIIVIILAVLVGSGAGCAAIPIDLGVTISKENQLAGKVCVLSNTGPSGLAMVVGQRRPRLPAYGLVRGCLTWGADLYALKAREERRGLS